MNAIRAFTALGAIDAKCVRRDAMLRWLVFYPIVVALIVRWGTPPVTDLLLEHFGFNLLPYYTLITSFLLLIMPALCGVVIGFLLLDQRDDQTITALQVTPLSLNGYLTYRLAMPMVMSTALTIPLLPLAGLVEIRFSTLLLASLCAAPIAPLYALFIASFAANKVQGFALMKAIGVLAMPPIFAYFVSSSWQYLFGLVPLYWPAKLFWMLQAGQPHTVYVLAAGLAYQGLLVAVLLGRFNRVMRR